MAPPASTNPTAGQAARLGLLFALWLLLRGALALAGGGPGEGHRLNVAGHEVAAILYRTATPAPTLVVVTHGGLASKETMLPACWQARALGADCLAVDLLGHGASGPAPSAGFYPAARQALRADRELGRYDDVRFIGHSLGAAVGRGAVFACDRSVAVGQATACRDRVVWGDLHRRLGLPDGFYVPVSHTLEPWSPTVVRRAVALALPGRSDHGADGVAARIGLAWASCLLMAVTGGYAARLVRASAFGGGWARGAAAACLLWAALALGGWRAIWYLVPSQPADWAIIGLTILAASALGLVGRLVGVRRGSWGVLSAVAAVEALACALYLSPPVRELNGLLLLPPFLLAPVGAAVALGERLSRPREGDPVESAGFASLLLGAFLALLVPAAA